MNKIKARNEKDWEEDVYTKSTLKWYWLAKDGTGWRYVRPVWVWLVCVCSGCGLAQLGCWRIRRDVECLVTRCT